MQWLQQDLEPVCTETGSLMRFYSTTFTGYECRSITNKLQGAVITLQRYTRTSYDEMVENMVFFMDSYKHILPLQCLQTKEHSLVTAVMG